MAGSSSRAWLPQCYHFVTGGLEAALTDARVAAGDKNVGIWGGANTVTQYLQARLLDELQVHVIPILLGNGVRLFQDLSTARIELRKTRSIDTPEGDPPPILRSRVTSYRSAAPSAGSIAG